MHRPVAGLCQGRRRESNITSEIQKVRRSNHALRPRRDLRFAKAKLGAPDRICGPVGTQLQGLRLRLVRTAVLRRSGTRWIWPRSMRRRRIRPTVLSEAVPPSRRSSTAILAFPHMGYSRRASRTAATSSGLCPVLRGARGPVLAGLRRPSRLRRFQRNSVALETPTARAAFSALRPLRLAACHRSSLSCRSATTGSSASSHRQREPIFAALANAPGNPIACIPGPSSC